MVLKDKNGTIFGGFDDLLVEDILKRLRDMDFTPEFYCRAMVTYEFISGVTAFNIPLSIGNDIKLEIQDTHKRLVKSFNKQLKEI